MKIYINVYICSNLCYNIFIKGGTYMFELSPKNLKKILLIITYAIVLCLALLNLDVVF